MEMEHATFVPVSPTRMTRALRAPAVVAASLPGWQPDEPDSSAPAGRLRLRLAGSTITYRGTVAVEGDAPPFVLTARGEEVRGTGTASARLEVALEPATHPEPGTTVTFTGTAEADGRLTSYDAAVVDAALRRLLDRFCAQLGENAPEEDDAAAPRPADRPPAGDRPAAEDDARVVNAQDHKDAQAGGDGQADGDGEADADVSDPAEVSDVSDVDDVPDDDIELVEVEVEVPESAAALDDLVSPAEAAHARRTMIGRSAEEVDHAPPRGRYAPEPAPDAVSAAATLRWAAPAAAALLASAVVVGRVLRRRR